jgi:hypothetical protein
MSENVIQTTFSSGELAPSMYARTDLAAYHQGLTVCRNFFVDYRSGISSRTGTKFIIQDLELNARLIGFSVSVSTTYVIEFGDHYCRFINNGASVLEAPFAITNVTNSPTPVVDAPGNNFANGDWVFITGVAGMPAINNRFYRVMVAGAFISLFTVNGASVDSTLFGTYTGGGTISRVYTITSPYAAADLPLIKFVESVSVLYITHPSYPPYTLSFFAPTNWVFVSIVFGTTQAAPAIASVVFTTTAPVPTPQVAEGFYAYIITAIGGNGQESLPSNIGNVNTGVYNPLEISAGTNTITITPPGSGSPAGGYNVYKAEVSYTANPPVGVAYGFIGIVSPNGTQFIDSNIAPDFSTTPPIVNNNPFASANNPGCCSFFQQRLYLASTTTMPATFWASQPGNFNNFNFSDPIQDDDYINGTIVSTQLNSVRSMLPMPGGLIMLTGHAAFTLNTGQGTNATLAVTPTNATIVPQAYNGASDVPPIVVNEDILYVQAKGAIVRDLSYNIYAAIYTGTDISIKSNHLFYNYQIPQWAWAEEPFKIVWAVRSDGVLLSLTFMKEQQISGWARHDTQGLYKSVATIQEGQIDATYVIVERIISGTTVQWIERFEERTFTYGVEDSWCVDAGNGNRDTLPAPSATILISGANGTVSISASAGVFALSSVGQVIRAGGGIITITGFVSSTQVTGIVTQSFNQLIYPDDVPPPFAAGSWSEAAPSTVFYGFDYLAGMTINVLADGGAINGLLVAHDGSITLPVPATKVVGGLPFVCQAQTMPLDVGEPTVQGKRKKIGALNLKLANSRGLMAGRTFNTLVYLKDLPVLTPLGQPAPLKSGDAHVVIDPLWDVPGQICLQISDPVPATILGIIPEYVVGDTK